ncbi:cytochrome P450 [Exidia glandulosa HHB12029]|uniref:Cytochrome P450 n=1 Tax=Exidia glandulosa HHB12029 TaxID=1314781 RepID=A0A165KPI4_EXIGL|nr:cytochrome P450 [Exidia glandulosa HHB12029]
MGVIDLEHFALDAHWRQILVAGVASWVAYKVSTNAYWLWRRSRSPLRDLPGPRAGWTLLFGHVRTMMQCTNNSVQEAWAGEYGSAFSFRSMLGGYQLITTDPRANTHILFASHIFQKPAISRRAISRFLGKGILFTEGEQHRDQRRILNPAFGFAHVRDMTDIFLDKGAQLRDIWLNKCVEAGGSVQIDAMEWMSKATLDAIGKAGFDYEFGTLNETGETNELALAFERIFRTDMKPHEQRRMLLNNAIPLLRWLAPSKRGRLVAASKKTMDTIGMKIVKEKKAAILAESEGHRIEKTTVGGKDLLSLLLQANLAADVEPHQRLSDEEVMDQLPTFLVAGHETTSNSTTWAMYDLATHPEAQARLREEVQQIGTDTPTLDMLNALPFLDNVVRETLRLHNVVAFVSREAVEDDIIPLGTPIVDRNGQTQTHIRVQKGDQVTIPIWLINRNKAIWGADADQFRPERWENPPPEAAGIPGIAPNLMSFIGGPRSCIGFRFALAEMKALLFHIIRGFEFKLAIEGNEIWSRTGVLMRPQLRSNNQIGLPVVLVPVA